MQVEKAEYDGRDVDLDKPFRLPSGSSKKFGVYVKDGDSVKKVTFGDPDMEIKRDDPEARANFRARHSCDTATDKTSARYWSCRMWESDATVSDVVGKSSGAEPLYVRRNLLNGEQFVAWAKANGFSETLTPDDIHVTIAFSKTPVLWRTWYPMDDAIVIKGGKRSIVPLGDKGAIVMKFDAPRIVSRWAEFRDAGASWDYQEYSPHLTITYKNPPSDLSGIVPFSGDLLFGPEMFQPINEDFADNVIEKRQTNDDIFTTEQEAVARSVDLGLGGDIHVHEDRDGQATYMPGSNHEAYLARYGSNQAGEPNMLERAIAAIIGAVSKSSTPSPAKETPITKNGGLPNTQTVLKVDTEQRIVWGWASVISENGEPIFDTQGDSIPPDVLTKAANEFMLDARIAKAMHAGEQVGEVIHSLPLTKELGDALGIQSAREGWAIAMKIHDDKTWEKIKSGEFRGFSIGGEAIRNAAS